MILLRRFQENKNIIFTVGLQKITRDSFTPCSWLRHSTRGFFPFPTRENNVFYSPSTAHHVYMLQVYREKFVPKNHKLYILQDVWPLWALLKKNSDILFCPRMQCNAMAILWKLRNIYIYI
jgi:hypothetical protein